MVEVVVESSVAEDSVGDGSKETSRANPTGIADVSISSSSEETSDTPDGVDVAFRDGTQTSPVEEEGSELSLDEGVVEGPEGPTSTPHTQDELQLLDSSSSPEGQEGPTLGVDSDSTVTSPGGEVVPSVVEDAMSPTSEGGKEGEPAMQSASRDGKEPLAQRRSSSTYKDGRPEPLFQRRT